jgi:hypothetical protein
MPAPVEEWLTWEFVAVAAIDVVIAAAVMLLVAWVGAAL